MILVFEDTCLIFKVKVTETNYTTPNYQKAQQASSW